MVEVSADSEVQRWEAVRTFIRLDRLGACAGLTFVVAVNGLVVRNGGVWLVVPFLLVLIGALTLASYALAQGLRLHAIALIAIGNWVVAIAVAGVLPFLWPVMVLTVVMPLVLATPFVKESQLVVLLAASAIAGGLVAITGLLGDDGGAIPDIDDVAELILVTGALVIHMVPIALIIWQNNGLQHRALGEAQTLNRSLIESQAEVAASRLRVVEAADRMRIQIERDLHDGTQQRLLALRLRLQVLQGSAEGDVVLSQGIESAQDDLGEAITELRELAHGIYPPVLRMHGIVEAIRAVVRRTDLDIEFADQELGRFAEPIERAVYFAASEALANVVKHASAARVQIELSVSDVQDEGLGDVAVNLSMLHLRIQDNGPGFTTVDHLESHGIFNMTDRIDAVGGQLSIASERGEGTIITVDVPLDGSL